MVTTESSNSSIPHAEPGDLPTGGEGGDTRSDGRTWTIDSVKISTIGGAVVGAGAGALGGPVLAGYCAAIGTYVGGKIGEKISGKIMVTTQSSSSSSGTNDQTTDGDGGERQRVAIIDCARLTTAGGAILGAAAGSLGGPVVAGNCAAIGTFFGRILAGKLSGKSTAAPENSFSFTSLVSALSDYTARILGVTPGN